MLASEPVRRYKLNGYEQGNRKTLACCQKYLLPIVRVIHFQTIGSRWVQREKLDNSE